MNKKQIYLALTRNEPSRVTAHVMLEQTETVLDRTKEAETTAFLGCLNQFGTITSALEEHAGEYDPKLVTEINGRYLFRGGCALEDVIEVLKTCGFELKIIQ